MNTSKTLRLLPMTFGVLAIIATAALPGGVRAKDPKPAPACAAPACAAPARTTRTLVAEERAVPVLSQIPYLGRFFKNVTHHEVDQIGVDFDFAFDVCPDCPQACKAGIAAGVCESTARPQLIVIRKTASGQVIATCSKDEPCCGKDEPCCGKECAVAAPCCEAGCEIICEEDECQGLTWERVIELTAKSAALEAMLDTHTAFEEEKSGLIETLAMSMVEKAKLEGKVEALAQQAELTKEMLTLVAENARLKAQAEAAESKLALVHEMTRLAIENEQLKLAARSRPVPAQYSNDVEYFPPSPTVRANHSAPAKKAAAQDAGPYTEQSYGGEPAPKPTR